MKKFIIILVLFSLTSCSAANDANDLFVQGENIIADKIPSWIKTDKIRAGYLFADDNPSKASLMSQKGLNTMIVKYSMYETGEVFDATIRRYTRWAEAAKTLNLHVFIAFNWQAIGNEFVYRKAVFADGTTSIAVCPLDKDFWTNHMNRVGKAIAALSLKSYLTIDGIFLDTEIYGTEEKRDYERTYGSHACFCDSCLSKFLISRGYSSDQFPIVAVSERQRWLRNNDLLEGYYNYLKVKVNSLATAFKTEVRKINPKLILGIYPTLTYIPYTKPPYNLGRNWVRESIAQAWGTVDFPMVLFATDTYYTGGYKSIPDEPVDLYRQSGINIVYCSGYLLSQYSGYDIETNLYQSAQRVQGYWLYKMSQTWRASEAGELKQGTQSQYLQMISNANNSIKLLK